MVGEEVGFVSGIDSDALGIGAEWTANEWLDVYGSIERSSLDASFGGSAEDLTVGLVGLKVSF
jgi:hypothetical protein